MRNYANYLIDFLSALRGLFTGRKPNELVTKTCRLLRREGPLGLWRVFGDLFEISYAHWIRCYDILSDEDRHLIVRHVESLNYKPLISVLVPVFNTPADFLQCAIDSVRKQLYPHWELCIADDASTLPHIRDILDRAVSEDARIHVTFRERNGHISAATNTALQMACGEFIALLDHDDELSEHALYMVAVALNENPAIDLLYSDEDKIGARGQRFGHYFKPDWNPVLFLSQNLISHLGVYRTRLAHSIGGFREGYEGAQDWDFALRFLELTKPENIKHLPHVLYHWRAISGSTATSIEAKDYASVAAKRALDSYWQRHGVEVAIEPVGAGHFITRLPVPDPLPLVSILILAHNDGKSLHRRLERVLGRTDYPNLEVLVVDNDSGEPATLACLDNLKAEGTVRVLRYPGCLNFAAISNWAVQQAKGSCLCLLNKDVEPINSDWLKVMVAHSQRPDIGVVGALLYYPDDRIQHAGVFLDGVGAGYIYWKYPRGTAGYASRARLAQNLSAVTSACLVVRKQLWDKVGGMDEVNFPATFNDVDFCLRVAARGNRNLWTPGAELYHYESATRGKYNAPEKQARFIAEIARLQERWGDLLCQDPAWNPNLAFDGSRIHLADPPRVKKPWLREAGKLCNPS